MMMTKNKKTETTALDSLRLRKLETNNKATERVSNCAKKAALLRSAPTQN